MSKKKSAAKTKKPQEKEKKKGLPSRQPGVPPALIKPATPEMMSPRFGPDEVAGLKLAYDLIQEFKGKAGYSIAGVSLRHHELDYLSKVAIIALQRTQLINELEFKVNELNHKISHYETLLGIENEDADKS